MACCQARMLAEAWIEYEVPGVDPPPFGMRVGARIPIGYCDDLGYTVYGNATLNVPPYLYAEASVLGRKHCYGDAESQAKFGHVWYVHVSIPVVSIYKDIFQGRDIELEVWGKHQGASGEGRIAWSGEIRGKLIDRKSVV